MSLPPIMLQPRDPEHDPPHELDDVFVFGTLGGEPPEWHVGYWTDEVARGPVWRVTDSSEPALEFERVFAWASMPPDPRQPPSLRAAA
jgi:hypothetical protein